MFGVDFNGKKGYVIAWGLLEESYEPSSTKFYEAKVEEMKLLLRNGGNYPPSYDAKPVEDVWDNDNLAEWEAGRESAETSGSEFSADNSADYKHWFMIALIIVSLLCGYASVFRFKWSASLLMVLLLAELVYFVFTGDPWYFSRIKEFDGA